VIIATRAALLAVPPSFKQAAIGMGASKMQAVFQFVLPRALPGIVTGSTIGLAQAIGETAPLLMIGMNNFVIKNEIPLGLGLFKEPFPALPTTIFLWASYADPLLSRYKANAAIVILLLLVFTFLAIATYIRRRANSANS
jgi:phosphate transport system permease protein